MPPPSILTVSLVLLSLTISSSATYTGDEKPTPYEILESYNFPKGIFPKGAVGYELDRETGKFKGFLDGACSFSLEGSYQLQYKSTITGTISQNKLTDLTGVSVKILFFWLNIVEVSRNGDDLDFSVGIASASFSVDNFYECPQCGCGLDCVGYEVRPREAHLSTRNLMGLDYASQGPLITEAQELALQRTFKRRRIGVISAEPLNTKLKCSMSLLFRNLVTVRSS